MDICVSGCNLTQLLTQSRPMNLYLDLIVEWIRRLGPYAFFPFESTMNRADPGGGYSRIEGNGCGKDRRMLPTCLLG